LALTHVEIKIASIPTVFVSIGGAGLPGEDESKADFSAC
jgi:hypothetical protein